MEERRKHDAVFAERLHELSIAVSDMSANVKLQTQALDQHKEISLLHLRQMEKEHEALKKIVFGNISDIQIIQKDLNFAKGMAKMATVGWTICTALLAGLIWLLTKTGVLS